VDATRLDRTGSGDQGKPFCQIAHLTRSREHRHKLLDLTEQCPGGADEGILVLSGHLSTSFVSIRRARLSAPSDRGLGRRKRLQEGQTGTHELVVTATLGSTRREPSMEILGVIIAGIIIGLLGKFVAPGDKDNIPIWLTIVCGIGGVLIGWFVYDALGGDVTSGVDWVRWIVAILVAAVLVVIASTVTGRNTSRTSKTRSHLT
jgi:uncharacterized membrane protein YeaQ/YmgE (transglycosylase-associated protein family)